MLREERVSPHAGATALPVFNSCVLGIAPGAAAALVHTRKLRLIAPGFGRRDWVFGVVRK